MTLTPLYIQTPSLLYNIWKPSKAHTISTEPDKQDVIMTLTPLVYRDTDAITPV